MDPMAALEVTVVILVIIAILAVASLLWERFHRRNDDS